MRSWEVMNSSLERPDPAAVFACALSLRESCIKSSSAEGWNLSECFNGGDEFLRQMMRIGETFERWACDHVAFEELGDVWPYLLEDHFGAACLTTLHPLDLPQFAEDDCVHVAMKLPIPIRYAEGLFLPLDIRAANPVKGSEFAEYHIRTARAHLENQQIEPFTFDDDPHDDHFGEVFIGLYGILSDEDCEHIADFGRYPDAVALVRKIAPEIQFPDVPVVRAPLEISR